MIKKNYNLTDVEHTARDQIFCTDKNAKPFANLMREIDTLEWNEFLHSIDYDGNFPI